MTRLGLGTVQFGQDYGIANRDGRTPEAQVAAILARAAENGVSVLDTAPAYGEAEAVLGRVGAAQRFRIVSKTPYFGSPAAFDVPRLRRSIDDSLERLGATGLDAILIHHPDDVRDLMRRFFSTSYWI